MKERYFRRIKVTTQNGIIEVKGGCTVSQEADLLVITRKNFWFGGKTIYVPLIGSTIEGFN